MTIVLRQIGYDSALDFEIFPADAMRVKRLTNLRNSFLIVGAFEDDKLIGLVYARKVFSLIPNITWIIREGYRGQGLASYTTRFFLREKYSGRFITALCRNEESRRVAIKVGFKIFWNFAVWFKSS
jgi:RimJ/RimL family protein N-acetyltransferase